jgi:hypothetical protein
MTRDVEAVRARWRPERITTLFVGEPAPASGAFFYYGNSALSRHMQRAVELALGEGEDFLKRFNAYGWYLDDLVLTPVNHLTKSQRKSKSLDAQNSLADRIAVYRPEAIVSLLMTIKPFVDAEATSLIPTLSCRSCRPNALSTTSRRRMEFT